MLERKQTLATGRKFWQEQFVWRGRKGRGHRFCLASTSQSTPHMGLFFFYPLPPHMVAAHIRNTKRHTWSRWLSKNKGFYQFVCHPATIYFVQRLESQLCLILETIPFSFEYPPSPPNKKYLHGGNTHSSSCLSKGNTKTRGAVTSIWERARLYR